MAVNSGQAGTDAPLALAPAGVFEPWEETAPAGPHGHIRALEADPDVVEAPRAVRQRTNLISEAGVNDLLSKVAGKDQLPAHIKRHLRECVEALTKRVEKSLKLKGKKHALIDQANELERGRIPSGVKPFKVAVDVPELDYAIPAELTKFSLQFTEGCTFRQAKEKLHIATIALNKVLDARVMERQVDGIRDSLTLEYFVTECGKYAEDRMSSADHLMAELGLGGIAPRPSLRIPKETLSNLYVSVMEKVAEAKKLEETKKVKVEETVAKKIEKLRDTAPHDLLDQKIKQSVSDALGKKLSGLRLDSAIDYGAAYSMIQADRIDLLEENIKEKIGVPPGLERQVFQKKPKKVKEKPGKGTGMQTNREKGKGKGKGKGLVSSTRTKGKGKGKSPKGKGKKGGNSAPWNGGERKRTKGGGKWSRK